jgi:hypothetical protein
VPVWCGPRQFGSIVLGVFPVQLVLIECSEAPMRNHPEIDVRYRLVWTARGQRGMAVLAMHVALVTMAAPDSCVDDLDPTSVPTWRISARTTGMDPLDAR